TGVTLWISRIDEKFLDLLEVQSRLAEKIVRSVAPHVRSAELKRVRIKHPAHQGAYDLFLRAQESMHSPLRSVFESAERLLEEAIQVNPQASRAWLWSAYTHAGIGNGSQAVQNVVRAMDLSPYDPLVCAYSGGASLAYLADGQYARAVEFAMRCISENRGYTAAYKALVLALVLSGRETEARSPANQLRLLEPTFTVEQFRRRSPAYAGALGERYCEAFERAGIPARS